MINERLKQQAKRIQEQHNKDGHIRRSSELSGSSPPTSNNTRGAGAGAGEESEKNNEMDILARRYLKEFRN